MLVKKRFISVEQQLSNQLKGIIYFKSQSGALLELLQNNLKYEMYFIRQNLSEIVFTNKMECLIAFLRLRSHIEDEQLDVNL